MRRPILAISRRSQRALKAIPIPGLALLLALVLAAVVNIAMPKPAFAVGTVAPLDPWPATPQMIATTGDLAGTFAISDSTNRLLVVLVCDYDNGGSSGQTFTATYGGKTLTQAFLENSARRQTWIGYLKETDIASRSGDAITITVTGTHTGVVAYIASYSGVDQTTPVTEANGVYVTALNNLIGGPLNVNAGGYGIYGWSGRAARTYVSDNESYVPHSNVDNPTTFNYGVASKALDTAGSTNPLVKWSNVNTVSVSFITLNPDSYPVPATTSISPATKTVGDAVFTLTVDGADFVSASVVRLDGADKLTTFVSSTQLTATIPASDLATAGGKSITVFNPAPGGGPSNNQTLTVNKATPTITWANPTDIVYGTALSSTQLCATASVPGAFAYSPDSGASLPAGNGQTLHVDFTPTDTANYNTASKDVTINVNKATLTVTANDRGKTYGDTVTFAGNEFTTGGLLNGHTVSSVTLTSAGAAGATAVGAYDIAASNALGTGLGNYNITYVNGTLTVNPKPLTITASDHSKTQGATVTFTGTEFSTEGLVNSDAVTSVTLTSAGAAAGATVDGSPYDIVPSVAVGTGLINYNITYVNGSLTVNDANTAACVIVLSDPSISGHSVTLTATVTGAGATGTVTFKDGKTILGSSTLSNGTATFTTSTLSAGSHSITAVYSGDANFAGSTSLAVDVTIKPSAVGLNWALIGGILGATGIVGLFFLLVVSRRRHKTTQQTQFEHQAQAGEQAQVGQQAQASERTEVSEQAQASQQARPSEQSEVGQQALVGDQAQANDQVEAGEQIQASEQVRVSPQAQSSEQAAASQQAEAHQETRTSTTGKRLAGAKVQQAKKPSGRKRTAGTNVQQPKASSRRRRSQLRS